MKMKIKVEVVKSDGCIFDSIEQSIDINEYSADSIKKDRIFLHIGECLYIIDSEGYIKDQILNINSDQKTKYGLNFKHTDSEKK